MRSTMVRTVSIILAAVLLVTPFILAGCTTKEVPPRTRVTVTDAADRQVSVAVPVQRVVLSLGNLLHDYAAVGGEEAIKRIVGWQPTKLWDYDAHLKYQEKFPQIESIPDVGNYSNGTSSVEKIISLKPDVVIFELYMLDKEIVRVDISRLEQAGIPSIVVDYWKNPPENRPKSTLLLGTLLGKEKRAQEVVNFYEQQVNKVTSRLEDIDKPKPKVYIEVGGKGHSEYSGTYGSDFGWGAVVAKAGGINIGEGIVKCLAPIHPEYVLKQNPDVIIITGRPGPGLPGKMSLGYYANPEESRELLKAFTGRPGWDTLNAVKNGRVYSILHPICGYTASLIGAQAFAKWFYPDEFRDLDPVASLKEFHKRFLPVDYSGVWIIGINE